VTEPLFSLLIVGYNCPEDVETLLGSLDRLPSRKDCEILIAENGSSCLDEMGRIARDHDATLVALANPGFGIACNTLARQSKGKFLLLANPDLRFVADILPGIVRLLEQPGIGAVGPVIRDEDGTEQASWNLPMDLAWEVREALGLQGRWRRRLMLETRQRDPQGPWEVGFATAACLAIPREIYRKVGGFDEGFFLNGEDIELCDRIREAGFRVLVDPSIEVVHGNSRIQGRDLRRFVADRLEGKRKYLSRRYRGVRLLVARALWVGMVLLRLSMGLAILRGSERTRLPGYRKVLLDSLKLLGKAMAKRLPWVRTAEGSTNRPGA
jgi:GT2 family glycosyltransferase